MGIEKRKYPRVDVNWPVTYSVDAQFVEKLVNISAGGAYIHSQRPLWADTIIHVTFSLPGSPTPIQAKAKVMWVVESAVDENGEITPGGMGIMFTEVSEADRKRLEEFIEKQEGT